MKITLLIGLEDQPSAKGTVAAATIAVVPVVEVWISDPAVVLVVLGIGEDAIGNELGTGCGVLLIHWSEVANDPRKDSLSPLDSEYRINPVDRML
mmetsp:Transcript_20986/g.58354  ORF Transcript_20986/g.58354 Transcript_20986/m.58354 type:complete len:95 (-) Transcript_20986:415-699(-)